jgi:hypothetical protein
MAFFHMMRRGGCFRQSSPNPPSSRRWPSRQQRIIFPKMGKAGWKHRRQWALNRKHTGCHPLSSQLNCWVATPLLQYLEITRITTLYNLDKKFVFDLSRGSRQSRIKFLHQSLKPRGFAGHIHANHAHMATMPRKFISTRSRPRHAGNRKFKICFVMYGFVTPFSNRGGQS